MREDVGERYLQYLMASSAGEPQQSTQQRELAARRAAEAAALCPRVLRGNELAWERWAHTFAAQRQLAALARYLPTHAPRLKPATYDMVLASLLLHPAGECRQAGCLVGLGCLCVSDFRAYVSGFAWRLRLTPCVCVAAEHALLLDAVRRWPHGIYSVPQLQAAVLRLAPAAFKRPLRMPLCTPA